MFLAETVFQSMDGSLSLIAMVVIAIAIIVLVTGLSMESKLARLIRIQRAIYDLMMAEKEENAKRRKEERGSGPTLAMPPPPLPASKSAENDRPGATKIYRID
jgi:type II secretory pathway pseudopilin PulG